MNRLTGRAEARLTRILAVVGSRFLSLAAVPGVVVWLRDATNADRRGSLVAG
jgi:hypothetical protein